MKVSIFCSIVLLLVSNGSFAFESEHQWVKDQLRLELWNFGLPETSKEVRGVKNKALSDSLEVSLKRLEGVRP